MASSAYSALPDRRNEMRRRKTVAVISNWSLAIKIQIQGQGATARIAYPIGEPRQGTQRSSKLRLKRPLVAL